MVSLLRLCYLLLNVASSLFLSKFFFISLLVGHKTYGTTDALGTREIIREEEEKQPSGKIFKYVVVTFYKIVL